MNKTPKVKQNNTLVKTIEKKYGIALRYKSDLELHNALKNEGLPSLSKLLKLTRAGSNK